MGQLNFDLEKISKRYKFLFIDTCSLLSDASSFYRENRTIQEKIEEGKSQVASANFFLDFLNQEGNLYTTSRILEEYSVQFRPTKKKRIKADNRKDSYLNKIGLKLSERDLEGRSFKQASENSRMELNKAKSKLEEAFICKSKVILLNEEEKRIYSGLESRYSWLRRKFDLSDTDFEFLLFGRIISYNRGPTAILSTDFGICSGWKEVLKRDNISPDSFGFYARNCFNLFSRLNKNSRRTDSQDGKSREKVIFNY